MKKIIVLSFALLAFNLNFAQEVTKSKSKPKFGLKGGLNIANAITSGEDSPNGKTLIGLNVGLLLEVKINNKFSFQPELLYSLQGMKFDEVVDTGDGIFKTNNTLKFSYINVPLMFKHYPNNKFYLEAGPQIGFLTSATLETSVVGQPIKIEQDFKEYIKGVDFGVNLGLGYDISDSVVISARYNLGLTNALDISSEDNSMLKNRVFSFSLGYKFK